MASAAIMSWSGTTGSWDNPVNWVGGVLPTSSDPTFINNSGTATLAGGVSGSAATLTVGYSGTGSLLVNGGQVTNASGKIGDLSTGSGSVTVTSGTWANSASLNVGMNGTGSLLVNGGQVTNNTGYIGNSLTGSGSATVTSGTWTNIVGLRVGDSGTGSLLVNGGLVTTPYGYIGSGTTGRGSATVTSGTWITSGTLTFTVGSAGTGSLLVNGGRVTNTSGVIGSGTTGSGSATVTSGTWTNSAGLTVGRSGTGTLNVVDTGVVSVDSGTVTIAQNASSFGTLNIGTGGAAGTLQATVVTSGSGTARVNFNHSGTVNFAPNLTGALAVTKLGAGTTVLSGSSTSSGGTVISAGALFLGDLGGAASVLGSGTVNVQAAGTLGGTGTVLGATTVSGALAPGNSPGAIHFASALTLTSDAVVKMEIASASSFDQIGVDGLLTYGGTLQITFLNGFDPAGQSFLLFNAASIAFGSQFAQVTTLYPGSFDPATGRITFIGVPEPGTLTLAGLGVLLTLLRRRRISRV